jgi:long-chain fatty acid transport protein
MRIEVLVVLAIVVGFSGDSMASGFALAEQSVSGLGNAFAGGSAAAEDASTVFNNPAGMTRIKGKQAVAGLHLVIPKAEFTDKGSPAVSSVAVPGSPSVPNFGNILAGGNGGDAGGAFPVPNLYYVETFDIGWSFGLGINVPFGLFTEYDSGWVGRYHGVKSKIRTINIRHPDLG